jgi:hypothetical protein
MSKTEHLQVGSIHLYFSPCSSDPFFKHRVEIKATNYRHVIQHAEGTIFETKVYAIVTAFKLGLISHQEASEALASLI